MRIQAVSNYNQYQLGNYAPRREQPIPTTQDSASDGVSFKGAFGDKVAELFGKYYAKPMCDQKWLQSFSESLSGVSTMMTQHMATLGSLITSSVYMMRTLKNKDLDPEKRKTLSINQLLCFIIPTACAYGVDHYMKDFNKNMEYRYSGLKEQQMALGKLTPEECAKLKKSLGGKLKCFSALAGLATFTLIYRYITPVVITPIANKIGAKINAKAKEKQEKAAVA